ncbi:sensor histidine kinase [Solidesulfovibrio carbinolicus]|uniref:histidine kinase n=1 Tax=Solidesulfovibrio carbinolicus TaxID=296842 RepID=A0A4P6HHG9_9BACT|nr:histidine kinase dimerization/phosphoacceptor domain -containing protein [Solidesulfovibrio carbinolicus]QAZ65794.1 diguanylate cyclase [Solidesulfovibrio carbinolicus]
MRTSPLSRVVGRSLFVRLVAPGLALLALLATATAGLQWRAMERDNVRLARTLAAFVSAYLDNAYGSLEVFARRLPDTQGAASGEALGELLLFSPSMRRLLWIDAAGMVAQTAPAGQAGADFPLQFDRLRGERLMLSRPLPSPMDGRLCVYLGVRGPKGTILAGELDLGGLAQQLPSMAGMPDARVMACDAYGNLIVHPESRLVAEQANIGDSPLFLAAKAGQRRVVYAQGGRLWLGTAGKAEPGDWLVLLAVPVWELVAPALYPTGLLFVFMAGAFVLTYGLLRKELRERVEEPLARFAASLPKSVDGTEGSAPFAELSVFEGAFDEMAKALVKNERLFRSSFEQAAVGMGHAAPDGAWLRVNDRLCGLAGRGRAELLAGSLDGLADGEDREALRAGMATALAGGAATFAREAALLRPNRQALRCALTVNLVRDEAGEPEYFLCVGEDVTDRCRAGEALRQSLEDKELLLREVHHRVKNNLQVISSLFFLQAEVTDNAEAREALLESRARVTSMALVHEGLYRTGDFGRIELSDYVSRLTHQLESSIGGRGGVRFLLCLEPSHLSIEKAAPLGLLLNELLTNAIKHAYGPGEAGEVRVCLSRTPEGFRVMVADGGRGLPEGFAVEACQTLGMQLVINLTRQLHGALVAENQGGATFTLTFPV